MNHFKIDESIGYIIGKTSFAMKKYANRLLRAKGYDITIEHLEVLAQLWEQEGLTQIEIAEKTIKDKTNISRILDVMERKDLILRHKDEHDRRAYKIFLTDKGKELKDKLTPIARDVNKAACHGLKKEELDELMKILNIIYNNLDEQLG